MSINAKNEDTNSLTASWHETLKQKIDKLRADNEQQRSIVEELKNKIVSMQRSPDYQDNFNIRSKVTDWEKDYNLNKYHLEHRSILINNLEKRLSLGYVPSSVLPKIAQLKAAMDISISDAKDQLNTIKLRETAITNELGMIEQQIKLIQEFDPSDEKQALLAESQKELNQELTDIKDRKIHFQAIMAANDPANRINDGDIKTPANELKELEISLATDTKTFTEGILEDWNRQISVVDKLLGDLRNEFIKLGNVKAKAILRDSELRANGYIETGIANKMKIDTLQNTLSPQDITKLIYKGESIAMD